MEISRPLFFGAIALSVVSAGLSTFAVLGRRAPVPVAGGPASACSCDDAEARREIAELRKALDARGDTDLKRLSLRVAALENGSATGSPPAGDDADRPATSARGADAPIPVFTAFDLPSKAISIRQEGTSLSVSNTDPAMTGKFFRIKARAEDGSTQEISIVVPAPGK